MILSLLLATAIAAPARAAGCPADASGTPMMRLLGAASNCGNELTAAEHKFDAAKDDDERKQAATALLAARDRMLRVEFRLTDLMMQYQSGSLSRTKLNQDYLKSVDAALAPYLGPERDKRVQQAQSLVAPQDQPPQANVGDPRKVDLGDGKFVDRDRLLADPVEPAPATVDPKNAGAVSTDRLGDTVLRSGNSEGAKQVYQFAADSNPQAPEPLDRLAKLAVSKGDRGAANAYASQALARDPGDKFAALVLGHGDALSRADGKASSQKIRLDLAADPGAPGAGAARTSDFPAKGAEKAGVLADPGDLAVDRASALALLSPARSPALPYIQKAQQKRAVGDRTAALLAATQAIDADRRNAAAWTIRAEIDDEMRNFPGAVQDATQALSLRTDDAQALRARAYAYLELGNHQAALADILRATELEPANGTGWLYRAMIEEKLGDAEAAKRDYAKAAALDPSLKPLADEGLARLGGAAPASSPMPERRPSKQLMRGGLIAMSLLFVILGLLGTGAGRRLTSRPSPSSAEATVLDEPAAAEIAPGSVLDGHYRVESELGRGGMGVVYAARDVTLDRPVAIKRLAIDGATSEDLERFLREARLVARLKHPNIAEIYNVVERPELLLVFEYVDGQPLDRVLAQHGRLAPKDVARVVSDVCGALGCAHEQKILHRDLKPSNVMVERGGRCRVMDFGIAHQARSGATFTQTSASGTPPYMAPEQALGSNSKASDLYALAVLAYELLTGARPFDGPDFLEQKLQAQFAPPSSKTPSLPAALDRFFAVALHPDPTKRHGDAAAFARAFAAAAEIC